MPILVLMRHSKAEPDRGDDHARPLADRGRADARDVRQWLLQKGIVPERAVVSTAKRTRETWELANPGTAQVTFDDRLYEARDLREVIGETTGDSVILVGHNPSVEALAHALDQTDETTRGMSTSAVAVFEVSDWDLEQARLTHFR